MSSAEESINLATSRRIGTARRAAEAARKKVETALADVRHLATQLRDPHWKQAMPGGAHFVGPRLDTIAGELVRALQEIHEVQEL
jgi:hypothetical protein